MGEQQREAGRFELEAWVNGNPQPKLHAFGAAMGRGRVVALCRISVRERRGTFDPAHADACPDCAEFVAAGLTFEAASKIVDERIQARMADPSVIVCRRR